MFKDCSVKVDSPLDGFRVLLIHKIDLVLRSKKELEAHILEKLKLKLTFIRYHP